MNTGKYWAVFLSLLAFTVVSDVILDNWHYKEGDHRRLQTAMNRIYERADRMYSKLQANGWKLNELIPDQREIVFFAFEQDSLIYWSDNSLSFAMPNEEDITGRRFQFIDNGWYVIKPYVSDSLRAFALILVKSQYPYENDYLVNGFQKSLKLPASTQLLTEPKAGSYSILDWEGIYLFSIQFNIHELRFAGLEKSLIPFLMFLTLIALLLILHSLLMQVVRPGRRIGAIFGLFFGFFSVRLLQYVFRLPYDLYELDVFSPVPFAKSFWLPSLGDLFVNSLLLLFVITEFCNSIQSTLAQKGNGKRRFDARIILLISFLTIFYLYTHFILSNLILHSTINFDFFRAASLNFNTVLGLLIASMHFAGLLLIANCLLAVSNNRMSMPRLLMLFFAFSAILFTAAYYLHPEFDYGSHLAFLFLFVVLAYMYRHKMPMEHHTSLALMVIFFSAFSVYLFSNYSRQRMINNMHVMAENLSNQHDPVAEYLFESVSKKLANDEVLKKALYIRLPDDQIFKYLQNNYFNGFWGKYKLRFAICYPYDDLLLEDSIPMQQMNCYAFYSEMLAKGSMQLPGTSFYYLDSQNGQINYLGWFTFKGSGLQRELTFFLELESRLVAEELGFPDLLLDRRHQKSRLLDEYSYGRYNKNRLVSQSGSFQYSLDLDTYTDKPAKFEGYNHLIHYVKKDNAVIVSKPAATFFDKLVSFSYIFLFYYIIILVFITVRGFSELGKEITFNFKNKIQLSIIAILFLSLILVGGGTIYFSIQQYQRKQHEILSEKIQSVYAELDHLLAYLPNKLSSDWKGEGYENLNQLLIEFSDVFYSDINLYDQEGNVLATSRSELFDQGIMGQKMDPRAYSKMVTEKQAEFIHREDIGKLTFLSAYVPFVNAQNKLLAYLNLPYFTRQNVLRSDVTTLVVAVVNIYVLLILLTVVMAVFISDQITRPLRLIQQRFSEIKLGKKNEQIHYKGRDEIAGLVAEYNRMVKELGKSLELLSRSERESAWREMAKQIAHEINNPLTPMKLSVQLLQRSWESNRENFDEQLQKVSRTLIEQIDNLSFIASEFSNFAKMPKALKEEINLVEKIRNTLTLFANTENTEFIFEPDFEKIIVYVDQEQLSRVFINLLKNAIQSIPENRQGVVSIGLILFDKKVRISITDNGKGIPEDLQAKLFIPSFTTKSSGMGIGLSIVKNIIESFGGAISFNTIVNQGTTFLFDLPIVRSEAGSHPEQTKNG
jgi:signal transduction histidine kinase